MNPAEVVKAVLASGTYDPTRKSHDWRRYMCCVIEHDKFAADTGISAMDRIRAKRVISDYLFYVHGNAPTVKFALFKQDNLSLLDFREYNPPRERYDEFWAQFIKHYEDRHNG